MVLIRAVAVVLTVFGLGPAAQTSRAERPLAITRVSVIDGTGAPLKQNQTIVVRTGRIELIDASERVQIPAGATVVDGTGKFLIPGLWDMHVHTRYAGIDHLRLLIANGITSARDMGAPWEHLSTIKTWQAEIAAGARIGPRLIAAGPLLDGAGSYWSHAEQVKDPAEAEAAVRRLSSSGIRYAKVYDLLARGVFFRLAEEAHARKLQVIGHVPLSVSVAEAVQAGQRSIEHTNSLLMATSTKDADVRARIAAGKPYTFTEVVQTHDAQREAALIAELRRSEVAVVPALALMAARLAYATDKRGVVREEAERYAAPAYTAEWKQAPKVPMPGYGKWAAAASGLVGRLHRSGVTILAGTDTVKPFFIPGASLHDELAQLVSAGMSPTEVIQAASGKAARFLGATDVGTIERGKQGDVVLLDANPLDRIENTRKIAGVAARGTYYDRATLDTMLAEIRQSAAEWKGTPTGQ